MSKFNVNYTCSERFIKYVQIDTQADLNSDTFPSTEKQKDLSRVLLQELKDIGIIDAEMDEFGYVYGTLPSNTVKNVPTICFCSHVDTSPETSGKNVKPVIHKNYQGGDIILPGDNLQIITQKEHSELKSQLGYDIITSDGTTLLGADDKAGLAEIMDAINFFAANPEIKHGPIKVLFTPDEEVGRGVDHVDLKKLGADFGYTLDGGTVGNVEDETFSADSVTIIVKGFNTHPGYAKNILENSVKIACDIIAALPKDSFSPETTEKREGFIHPVSINGGVEQVELRFIVRDFENQGLLKLEEQLKKITENVCSKYKRTTFDYIVKESYRNMKYILKETPQVVEYALEAVKRAGITPNLDLIRGGTDGCRLSFMGLPCPNIFAGQHGIHSKQEWISIQDMQKAVDVIINLAVIWEEKA
ncbi:peptidase T [soil metagenome]